MIHMSEESDAAQACTERNDHHAGAWAAAAVLVIAVVLASGAVG